MAKIWISPCKGCWVDLFEAPNFRGRRIRLYGPADYIGLPVSPEEGPKEPRSLSVGPAAYVLCFQEFNPTCAVWFTPRQRVADLEGARPEDILDSIRVFDRPPFSSEPAFDAYAAAQDAPDTIKLPAVKPPRRPPKT